MNRGSPSFAAPLLAAQFTFNEAPIHESGKSLDADMTLRALVVLQ